MLGTNCTATGSSHPFFQTNTRSAQLADKALGKNWTWKGILLWMQEKKDAVCCLTGLNNPFISFSAGEESTLDKGKVFWSRNNSLLFLIDSYWLNYFSSWA